MKLIWWTKEDQAIVRAFKDWQIGRRADLPAGIGRCRHCEMWQSEDGKIGMCQMPTTPSTVNCGEQPAESGCEQWGPR